MSRTRYARIGFLACALACSPFLADRSLAALIALAGDSTVASNTGWGDALAAHLQGDHIVNNQAAGGRSTKSFITEGRWSYTLNLNPDYVLIQFGHNDQKLDESNRGAYPIDNPPGVVPGKLDLYRDNLRGMINDVIEIGATPLLLTPVARRGTPHSSAQAQLDFNNSPGPADSLGNSYSLFEYAEAVRAVGIETGVTVIDLNQLSLKLYIDMIGRGEDIATLGPNGDNTHFNSTGAQAIASLVAEEWQDANVGLEPGDVNGDGSVDLEDFDAIRRNFRDTVVSRTSGDLNRDGVVDFVDFREWKAAFEPLSAPAALQVPEPATPLLIGAAVSLFTQRLLARLQSFTRKTN